MKTLFVAAAMMNLLSLSVWAENAYSYKATKHMVFVSDADSDVIVKTNLVVYGPPYGTNPPANFHEMVKTNGLECCLNIVSEHPMVCWVYVFNHSTNAMACLLMPTANVCRIALLDQQGHQVKQTVAGMKCGLPLSQEQIGLGFRHWNLPNQSPWLNLYPNGIPKFADVPREICNFSLKDVFEIKKPGDYELHLQMRLIQTDQDSSGKLHYPVTWLPEVVVKVQVDPEDIPK